MDQTYTKYHYEPKHQMPIAVIGLPGIASIGSIATQLLVENQHASIFAELYSPLFPDYVAIDEKGICRPPRYEFYASTMGKGCAIIRGDAQLPLEDTPAHNEICGEVLDLLGKFGCRFIITIDGIPTPRATRDIYIAATSDALAKKYAEKNASIFKDGRIIGPSGLLIGLAKTRGLKGICVLTQTTGVAIDEEAALHIYKFLKKILETNKKD